MNVKTTDAKPKPIIEAGRAEKQYWQDLWRYRELFYFLAWRDILVRYKQTAIGVAWALIHHFLTMVVFTVVFGNLAKLPSDNPMVGVIDGFRWSIWGGRIKVVLAGVFALFRAGISDVDYRDCLLPQNGTNIC